MQLEAMHKLQQETIQKQLMAQQLMLQQQVGSDNQHPHTIYGVLLSVNLQKDLQQLKGSLVPFHLGPASKLESTNSSRVLPAV